METAGAGAPTSMDALDAKLDAFLPPPAATTAAPPPAPPPARSAWLKATDPASGAPYWYNEETGESSWTPPPGAPVPPPAGPPPTQVWDFVCRHSYTAPARKRPQKQPVPTSARTRACAHMHTRTHTRSTHACKLARSLAHALRRRHARTGGWAKQANRRPDGDATRKARCAPAGNDDPLLLAGLVSVSVSPASPFSLYSLSLLSLPLSLTHSLIHTYTHTHTHTCRRASSTT